MSNSVDPIIPKGLFPEPFNCSQPNLVYLLYLSRGRTELVTSYQGVSISSVTAPVFQPFYLFIFSSKNNQETYETQVISG
jgi:hypothetical protein